VALQEQLDVLGWDQSNVVPDEAVQRPTMNFVAIKTPEQSDLLSLHRIRSRLVWQRTAIINQIHGFLIERGITVRQGPGPLRKVLPQVLSSPPEALSPRILRSHRRAR
jgi:transposase